MLNVRYFSIGYFVMGDIIDNTEVSSVAIIKFVMTT